MVEHNRGTRTETRELLRLATALTERRVTDNEELEHHLQPLIAPHVIEAVLNKGERALLFECYRAWCEIRPYPEHAAIDLIKFGGIVIAAGVPPENGANMHVCMAKAAQTLCLSGDPAKANRDELEGVVFSNLKAAFSIISALPPELSKISLKSIEEALQCLAIMTTTGLKNTSTSQVRSRREIQTEDKIGLLALAIKGKTIRSENIGALFRVCEAVARSRENCSAQYRQQLTDALTFLFDYTAKNPFLQHRLFLESGLRRLFDLQITYKEHHAAYQTALKLFSLSGEDTDTLTKTDNYLVDAFEQAVQANDQAGIAEVAARYLTIEMTRKFDTKAKLRLLIARRVLDPDGPLSAVEVRKSMAQILLSNDLSATEYARSTAEILFDSNPGTTLKFLSDFHDLVGDNRDRQFDAVSLLTHLLDRFEKTKPTETEIYELLTKIGVQPKPIFVQSGMILARALLDSGKAAQAGAVCQGFISLVPPSEPLEKDGCLLILAVCHLTLGDKENARKVATQLMESVDNHFLLPFLGHAINCYTTEGSPTAIASAFGQAMEVVEKIGGEKGYGPLAGITDFDSICQLVENSLKNRTLHRWHLQ